MILMHLWTPAAGMVIWLAGLQSMPASAVRSRFDRREGPWRRFWNVTVADAQPVHLFNAIIGLIGTMQMFQEAFIMTPDAKPVDSTLFYAFNLFSRRFSFSAWGTASGWRGSCSSWSDVDADPALVQQALVHMSVHNVHARRSGAGHFISY